MNAILSPRDSRLNSGGISMGEVAMSPSIVFGSPRSNTWLGIFWKRRDGWIALQNGADSGARSLKHTPVPDRDLTGKVLDPFTCRAGSSMTLYALSTRGERKLLSRDRPYVNTAFEPEK
jgi:hypothetical protein